MRRSSFLRRLAVALFAPAAFSRGPNALGQGPKPAPAPTSLPLGERSLVASGGLCAPMTPLYAPIHTTPIRDALPSFQAQRGGLTWDGGMPYFETGLGQTPCEHLLVGDECVLCFEHVPIS